MKVFRVFARKTVDLYGIAGTVLAHDPDDVVVAGDALAVDLDDHVASADARLRGAGCPGVTAATYAPTPVSRCA